MTQKEALIFQTPAMEMPWHVSVKKNHMTGLKRNQFYSVSDMFQLIEEEANNVANFGNTAYNKEIAFNFKSETEMVSLPFTVCFGII